LSLEELSELARLEKIAEYVDVGTRRLLDLLALAEEYQWSPWQDWAKDDACLLPKEEQAHLLVLYGERKILPL
jgi:hypothetical protein